ncbi:MAG: hypothetical protein ACOC00_07665 [Halothiobacillaceae bacterium]
MAKVTKCRDCGGMVSASAKHCPHCGAKVRKPAGLLGWALALMVGFSAYTFWGDEPSDGAGQSAPAPVSEIGAWSACKSAAKARLKAPATAEFPWRPDSSSKISTDQMRVTGYVDAQNGYGAVVRSQVVCAVDDVDGRAVVRTVTVD